MTNPTDDRANDGAELLARAARALPPEIEPPAALWPAVQDAIAQRRVRAMPGHRAPGAPGVGPHARLLSLRMPRWALGAAATLVVVAGAVAVQVVVRGRDRGATADAIAFTPVRATPAQAAAMIATLDVYDAAARELTVALHGRRGALRPATIAAVEQSLRTIDTAIAEARGALEKDPAGGVVYDLLLGMYRQKLELLRRSALLAQS